MGNKKLTGLSVILLFLLVVANASALTAKIGNARMTLRAEVGEEVTRSILVINDNDEDVNISMTPSGGLAENVKLEEAAFTLSSGEEKKVFFDIHADEPGTTETRINVGFTPADGEGNNAGFASVITFIASGEGTTTDEENGGEIDGEENSVVDEDESEAAGFSTARLLLVVGIILIIALIILLVFASKRNKASKKRPGRSRA